MIFDQRLILRILVLYFVPGFTTTASGSVNACAKVAGFRISTVGLVAIRVFSTRTSFRTGLFILAVAPLTFLLFMLAPCKVERCLRMRDALLSRESPLFNSSGPENIHWQLSQKLSMHDCHD